MKNYLALAKAARERGGGRLVFRRIMKEAIADRAFDQAHTIGIRYEDLIPDKLIAKLAMAVIADRQKRRKTPR